MCEHDFYKGPERLVFYIFLFTVIAVNFKIHANKTNVPFFYSNIHLKLIPSTHFSQHLNSHSHYHKNVKYCLKLL